MKKATPAPTSKPTTTQSKGGKSEPTKVTNKPFNADDYVTVTLPRDEVN